MNTLQAVFLFRTDELWVKAAALGTEFALTYDKHAVRIALPKKDDDFRSWKPYPGDLYRAIGRSAGREGDPDRGVGVLVLRVTVDTSGEVSSEDFMNNEGLAAQLATKILDDAYDLASKATLSFLRLVRALHGFHWLGLSNDEIASAGPSDLIETSTGRRLPVGHTQRIYGVAFSHETALAPTDIEQLLKRVADGEMPPVAEALLADAEHLATAGLRFVSSDALRAVLMAAIACEVKAKINLRERASQEQKSMIEYMLSNQREITLTAAELFNSVMKASQGRSMQEDDEALFEDVQTLFKVRNRVAHQGQSPTIKEARALVAAARRAFNWLDGKPNPAGTK